MAMLIAVIAFAAAQSLGPAVRAKFLGAADGVASAGGGAAGPSSP